MNIPLSYDSFIEVLISQLTNDERRDCIAYAVERNLLSGLQFQFPDTKVEISADSYLGFIDREPSANWGHSARYVIVNKNSGEIRSLDARFPPFGIGDDLRWIVVYQAPSVSKT